MAGEESDFARFDQLGDAADEFLDDGVLLFHQRREVEFDPGQLDPAFGGVVPGPGVAFAEREERLGRNAADIEAGSAKGGAFFDQRDLEAELGGAKGAHITTGTGADDGNVK